MFTVGMSLVVLSLITLVLLAVEVRQYTAGRRLISRRRFVLRLAAGLLMLALLVAVFVGLFVVRLTDARGNLTVFMGYWFGCMMIAAVLVWVMLADMREVEDRFTQRQHEIWRDMARFIAEQPDVENRAGSGSAAGDKGPGDREE